MIVSGLISSSSAANRCLRATTSKAALEGSSYVILQHEEDDGVCDHIWHGKFNRWLQRNVLGFLSLCLRRAVCVWGENKHLCLVVTPGHQSKAQDRWQQCEVSPFLWCWDMDDQIKIFILIIDTCLWRILQICGVSLAMHQPKASRGGGPQIALEMDRPHSQLASLKHRHQSEAPKRKEKEIKYETPGCETWRQTTRQDAEGVGSELRC